MCDFRSVETEQCWEHLSAEHRGACGAIMTHLQPELRAITAMKLAAFTLPIQEYCLLHLADVLHVMAQEVRKAIDDGVSQE